MIVTVLALLLAAFLATPVTRIAGSRASAALATVPLAGFVYFLIHYLPPSRIEPSAANPDHVEAWSWFPALGVELAFSMDGLSLLFALLILGIGALVVLYTGGYLAGDPHRGRFLTGIFVFMAAMLGVVLSDNLIVLFVFWELTGIASYFLISHENKDRRSRDAALQALLITGAGGLALLCGFILLGLASLELSGGMVGAGASDMLRAMSISALAEVDVRQHDHYIPAVILILVGAFTKSAQFPFHSWLPAAMAAPTPASSYLHSATMVKAGIYLVARLQPALGDTWLWTISIVGVGTTTLLLAVTLGIRQRDLKRLLAYSTLAVLGTLMALLGLGTEGAITAALTVLLAHALYKAALFMAAGNIDHGTGTRDIARLGGLRRTMPVTATATLLAAASMAGAAPFLGFIAKDLLYAGTLDLPPFGVALLLAVLVGNILLVAIALLVAVKPFSGPATNAAQDGHEAPWSMLVSPLMLAALGLVLGLAPGTLDPVLGAAATAVAGEPTTMHLALWHGVHARALLVLGLSAVTLGGGVVVYRRLCRRLSPPSLGTGPSTLLADRIYQRALAGLFAIAARFSAAIQNGHLSRYIAVILGVTVTAVCWPLLATLTGPLAIEAIPIQAADLGIAILVVAGALGAALLRTHLGAIAALGISGLGIALIFAIYSAPDLALTLLVVEVLTVLVLALVFRRLPAVPTRSSRRRQLRDGVLALACGALATGLTLASAAVHLPADAARYFADASVPEGKGQNVVNVILVDFRALDTLGEIVVVAVAGLGVLALLRVRALSRGTGAAALDPAGQPAEETP